ncbi:MAG: glycosyltransferase family 2 protein [Betaproteobacteria bacterium]|nr:glycosyltransferase family 2 protein [Betaproteobacteria bacterium]
MSPAAAQPASPAAPGSVAHPPALVQPLVSVVMPCLNEERTVATCVGKALAFFARTGIAGEVVIADNGSRDASIALATAAGARVVRVSERGYGAALMGGILAARGRWVVMGDADDSYDFGALDGFVEQLAAGAQLVMGNRFAGGIAEGAMPPLHRYLGNPVLSFIGRLLFRSPIGDFHCGLRAFDREAVLGLGLSSPGMEFASEMVMRATLAGLRVAEVPTTLAKDGRDRPPHLRSWRDGWRHLRLLLMFSPRWLLLYPGMALCGIGALLSMMLTIAPIRIGPVGFDIQTLLYCATASVLGLQMCMLAVLTKAAGVHAGHLPASPGFAWLMRVYTLERGILLGLALLAGGLAGVLSSVWVWTDAGLAALDPSRAMRVTIPSVSLLLAGSECIFGSFVLSFITQPRARLRARPVTAAAAADEAR